MHNNNDNSNINNNNNSNNSNASSSGVWACHMSNSLNTDRPYPHEGARVGCRDVDLRQAALANNKHNNTDIIIL